MHIIYTTLIDDISVAYMEAEMTKSFRPLFVSLLCILYINTTYGRLYTRVGRQARFLGTCARRLTF